MTSIFIGLAVLSFVGFFIASMMRNGHRMAYSAVVCAIWILLAAWWSGAIGAAEAATAARPSSAVPSGGQPAAAGDRAVRT